MSTKHGLSDLQNSTIKRHKSDIEGKKSSIAKLTTKLKEKRNSKDEKINILDTLTKIKARATELKSKLQHKKSLNNDTSNNAIYNKPTSTLGLGLDTQVHPLLRQLKEEKLLPNKYLQYKQLDPEQDQSNIDVDHIDSNLIFNKKRNHIRRLQFNEPGKFIEKAEELRYQARMAELQRKLEIEAQEKRQKSEIGISANERKYKCETPPLIEWWDAPYGPDGQSPDITHYIQHPIMIKAPWEVHQPKGPLPLHLTKREQKRLRKNTRSEIYKNKQDRIRLGLDPVPPPKVRLSNLISVLSSESLRDPTEVEMRVRKEVEERRLKHEQDNADRKLTKEQNRAKLMQKSLDNQKKNGIFSAVFRIESLVDNQHRYKINVNARELHLTGITMLNPHFNLVIVEGSARDVLRYKKLLLRRIDWTQPAVPRDGSEAPDLSKNQCRLVWEGQIKTHLFKFWTTENANDEVSAQELLSRNQAVGYWITAKSLV